MTTASSLFDRSQQALVKSILRRPLEEQERGHRELSDIHIQRFSGSSSFSTGRVTAFFDDGKEVSVFAKDLNPSSLLPEARMIRPAGLERSRREVWMYEHVLAELRVGTPQHLATLWDGDHERYWLFLEDVGPKRLSRLGDFELWTQAAAWLGRFHAAVRSLTDAAVDHFVRIQPPTRVGLMNDLEAMVRRVDPDDRHALEKAASLFDGLVKTAWKWDSGLVHGEFFGKNVVIRGGSDEPIAVVDWETAGFGPQLIDLVSICAGRWTPEQRAAMRSTYYETLSMDLGTRPARCDFEEITRALAVVRAVSWLMWWANGDDAHISRWMREVKATMAEFDGRA